VTFLAWQYNIGSRTGKGEKPATDPPAMEGDDIEAWNFYCRNARAFVQEFGLMAGRIARLGYRGVAREVFEDKLSLIHDKELEIRMRDMREEQEAGAKRESGDVVLVGDENG